MILMFHLQGCVCISFSNKLAALNNLQAQICIYLFNIKAYGKQKCSLLCLYKSILKADSSTLTSWLIRNYSQRTTNRNVRRQGSYLVLSKTTHFSSFDLDFGDIIITSQLGQKKKKSRQHKYMWQLTKHKRMMRNSDVLLFVFLRFCLCCVNTLKRICILSEPNVPKHVFPLIPGVATGNTCCRSISYVFPYETHKIQSD